MKAFGEYNPITLFIYFLSVIILTAFVQNPVIVCSALLGAVLFCATLSRRREIGSDAALYIPLFLLVAVTNPLFSHNGATPLFYLFGHAVTVEAFVCGAGIAAAVVAVMIWCKCLGKVMTGDKTLYLFGKTLPKLATVISCAMRFVPMFVRRMKKVSRAQKSMGLYSSKSVSDRVKGALRVFTSTVAWSLESSMQTASAMKARGGGLSGRTHFSLFRFYPRDGVLCAVCAVLTAMTVVGSALGATEFSYYPRIADIPFSPLAVTVYAAFGLLSLVPFIIEVKEALAWKYCVSKI